MFSLLYGAITGVEYFSDDDETSSSLSSSSSPEKHESQQQLSSSFPSSSSVIHLSQTTIRSVQSPRSYSIGLSSTDDLGNTGIMIGRYHDMSHCAVSSGPTLSLGGWHHGDDFSTSLNDEGTKINTSRTTSPTEIQSAKGRYKEASGSCRRRHRSPTP